MTSGNVKTVNMISVRLIMRVMYADQATEGNGQSAGAICIVQTNPQRLSVYRPEYLWYLATRMQRSGIAMIRPAQDKVHPTRKCACEGEYSRYSESQELSLE